MFKKKLCSLFLIQFFAELPSKYVQALSDDVENEFHECVSNLLTSPRAYVIDCSSFARGDKFGNTEKLVRFESKDYLRGGPY